RLCSITRARNSLRSLAYASSVIKLSRLIRRLAIKVFGSFDIRPPQTIGFAPSRAGQSVGDPQQRQRMFLPGARVALLGEPFENAPAGDRAIGAHVVGIAVVHPPEHRAPDFHRIGVELALDPPRAVVTGTALDRVDRRIGHL